MSMGELDTGSAVGSGAVVDSMVGGGASVGGTAVDSGIGVGSSLPPQAAKNSKTKMLRTANFLMDDHSSSRFSKQPKGVILLTCQPFYGEAIHYEWRKSIKKVSNVT